MYSFVLLRLFWRFCFLLCLTLKTGALVLGYTFSSDRVDPFEFCSKSCIANIRDPTWSQFYQTDERIVCVAARSINSFNVGNRTSLVSVVTNDQFPVHLVKQWYIMTMINLCCSYKQDVFFTTELPSRDGSICKIACCVGRNNRNNVTRGFRYIQK